MKSIKHKELELKEIHKEKIKPQIVFSSLERIQNTFTSKRHYFEKLNNDSISIFDFFTKNISHIERETWPKRFSLGGVFVNGEPISDLSFNLNFPCKIEYYEPKFDINDPEIFFPKFQRKNIIYEQDGIVVYYKPRKLPTTPSKEQDKYNLRTYLEDYYKSSVHLPSRLDTSTQGLVIGSYKEESHTFVQKLFEYKQIQKYYVLEVCGKFPYEIYECDFKIKKSSFHPVLREASLDEGKDAKTIFKLLKYDENKDTSLLLAKPITGRTHQIRVHASALGFSIIGDNFYNGKIENELHLACVKLEFFNQNNEKVEIAIPKDFKTPSWLVF